MISAGIDIGSRTVKLVVIEDGELCASSKRENTFDPLGVCRELLAEWKCDTITATGYGRHLFAKHNSCAVISEIKAFALGARTVFPNCQTLLDIGGQDIKVISLDQRGQVRKFEMNDKCSAGTGRFLEIMAMALGCNMDEFSALASVAESSEKINSMCTVFAESEVISLLARGAKREDVALGIHQSIVNRAKSMMGRIDITEELVFLGGVALNPCVVTLLQNSLQRGVLVPADPQSTGALGCALYGAACKGSEI